MHASAMPVCAQALPVLPRSVLRQPEPAIAHHGVPWSRSRGPYIWEEQQVALNERVALRPGREAGQFSASTCEADGIAASPCRSRVAEPGDGVGRVSGQEARIGAQRVAM